ncbi:innexin inx2-like [Limulus polyphemus]|uniref:Innexin n=1 Tax=Limulus polyphemus TaxID=6850 RepID=A0ABM1SXB3_LIMPO|nr:innexin inx2-like [Limulus polyphemus]XP_013780371.1 innexin inx2-like [Limulus polyphemus]XP_022248267.1 innexin inx2-like [Limulus polyphemus]XP_022248268.1 innexin inx2-like [Limulus polyphemus]XP_022248269.1 innexin inx2-like [Limulus polyphemus]
MEIITNKLFNIDLSFLKLKINTVYTDNQIFRLHYRGMTVLLLAFSISVTAYQFFGEPIYCIQRDDIPEKLLNTYCWIEGTFTLPKAFNKKVGIEVVYPGVETSEPEDQVVVHAYYQWVCFVLLFQAVLFYIPRYIWRSWEGGKIKKLCLELTKPVLKREEKETQRDMLVNYFLDTNNNNGSYALRYFFCEIMNFINILGQIYFTDYFLGQEFTKFGPQVVKFTMTEQEERLDPMVKVFPRMTKCSFQKFGSSGDVQRHDALCLLPLNIVNEKIFVVLWFCFVILAALTGLNVLYRLIFMVSSAARYTMLRSLCRFSYKDEIEKVLEKLSHGDYFILHLLAFNIHSAHMKEVISKLAEGLHGRKPSSAEESMRENSALSVP